MERQQRIKILSEHYGLSPRVPNRSEQLQHIIEDDMSRASRHLSRHKEILPLSERMGHGGTITEVPCLARSYTYCILWGICVRQNRTFAEKGITAAGTCAQQSRRPLQFGLLGRLYDVAASSDISSCEPVFPFFENHLSAPFCTNSTALSSPNTACKSWQRRQRPHSPASQQTGRCWPTEEQWYHLFPLVGVCDALDPFTIIGVWDALDLTERIMMRGDQEEMLRLTASAKSLTAKLDAWDALEQITHHASAARSVSLCFSCVSYLGSCRYPSRDSSRSATMLRRCSMPQSARH